MKKMILPIFMVLFVLFSCTQPDGLDVNKTDNPIVTPTTPTNTLGLTSLTVTPGIMDSLFDPADDKYTVDVSSDVSAVLFTATANPATASLLYNGNTSSVVSLVEGANTVTISVVSDGVSEVYTVTVNRGVSGNSGGGSTLELTSLSFDKGVVNTEFDSETMLYILDVATDATEVVFTAAANPATATILYNGEISPIVNLDPVITTVVSVLVSAGSESNQYNVIINKTLTPVATVSLSSLSATTGSGNVDFSQTFSSTIKTYSASVDDLDDSITFTAVADPVSSVITYNGSSSSTVSLNEGVNSIEIVVAGTPSETYYVNITKGEVAKLSNMIVDGVALDQVFDIETYNYTGTVTSTTTSIGLTGTSNATDATITYTNNGVAVVDSSAIALSEGANTIVATVLKGSIPTLYTFVITKSGQKTLDNVIISGANSVEVLNTIDLSAVANYSDASYETTGFVWSSDNTSVATVNATGTVTGVSTGTAVITAEKSGVSDTISITVTPESVITITGIVISGNSSVNEGGDITLSATAAYSDLSTKTSGFTWVSDNTSIATVDASGKVTGLSAGTATISASMDGAISQKSIEVKAPITDKIILHYKSGSASVTIHHWNAVPVTIADTVWASKPEMTNEGNGWFGYTIDGAESSQLLFVGDTQSPDLDRTAGEWWYDGEWHAGDPDDDVAPTVSLTSPADGASLSGTVTLSATADDNIGVAKVEFFDGTTLIEEVTSAPYSINWNTAMFQNGSKTVSAKATDGAGNEATDTIIVTTTNVGVAPIADAGKDILMLVGNTAIFNAGASYDPNGSIVSYSWDNGLTGLNANKIYSTTGTYTVILTVTDDEGLSSTDTLKVEVVDVIPHRDFREETVYFMMTDRFADGDPNNNNI